MQQVLKATLMATAIFGLANAMFAQVEGLPQFHDQQTTENPPSLLPPPKQKGAIEQYQQGHFYGFRMDDSVIITAKFDKLEQPYSDFMVAKIGKKQGVINGKGETLLAFEFDNIEKFEFEKLRNGKPRHTGFRWLKVSKGGKFGLLNREGKEIMPFEWNQTSYTYGDTLMIFSQPGLQRLIGPSGQILLETNYDRWDEQIPFIDPAQRIFCVIKDRMAGLIDIQNRVILPFEFQQILWVNGNFACVGQWMKKQGLVNLQGKKILPFDSIEIKEMDENGLFPVKDISTGLCGLADSSGLFRMPLSYEYVQSLTNSPYLLAHLPDSLSALFEVNGRQLTEFIYSAFSINPALPGLLLAQSPDKNWRFLDAAGQPLSTEMFEDMHYTQTGFTGRKNGKTAFFNLEGRRLTDYKFAKGMGIGKNDQAIYANHVSLPEGRVLIGRVWDEAGRTIYIDDLGGEHLSRN